MRQTIALRIDETKKQDLERTADRLGTTTSAVTAAFVKAGVDASAESDKTVNDFLAGYLDDRQIGRPAGSEDG